MRLLLATFWGIPGVGGVWTLMAEMRRELERRGHRVDVLGYSPGRTAVHMVGGRVLTEVAARYADGLPANDRAFLHPVVNMYELQRYRLELAATELIAGDYDVVHTQDAFSTVAFSRILPASTPLVASLHGDIALELVRAATRMDVALWTFLQVVEGRALDECDRAVLSCEWLRSRFAERFALPADRVAIVRNGMDVSGFAGRLAAPGPTPPVRPGQKVILFAGRLTPMKGVGTLLAALALLADRRRDWCCWICGSGEDEDALGAEAARLGLSRSVTFLGLVGDVAPVLGAADVVVLPSLTDTQPYSAMEAQVAGKVVVVSDRGGLPEMVDDGETGLVFPAGDPQALADRLETVLADDGLRARVGAQAEAWGRETWSIQRMADELLAAYEAVAGAAATRVREANAEYPDPVVARALATSVRAVRRGAGLRPPRSTRARVVHLLPALGPWDEPARVVTEITRRTPSTVDTVVCCMIDPGDGAGELATLGVPVVALSLDEASYRAGGRLRGEIGRLRLQLVQRTAVDPAFLVRLTKLLAVHRADVLHVHTPVALAYGTLAARAATPRPHLVFTAHGSAATAPASARWRAVVRLANATGAHWVAPTPDVADALRGHGAGADRLVTIPSGVDLGGPRRRAAREGTSFTVGMVVTPDRQADAVVAMRSVRRMHEHGQRCRLRLFLAPGVDRNALVDERWAGGLVDDVSFADRPPEMGREAVGLDAFIARTGRDALPTEALHVMAAGVPVVGERGGVVARLSADGQAAIAAAFDGDALAAALLGLARSPDHAAAIGAAGRRLVEERFSIEETAAAYAALYACIAREGRSSTIGPVAGSRA